MHYKVLFLNHQFIRRTDKYATAMDNPMPILPSRIRIYLLTNDKHLLSHFDGICVNENLKSSPLCSKHLQKQLLIFSNICSSISV